MLNADVFAAEVAAAHEDLERVLLARLEPLHGANAEQVLTAAAAAELERLTASSTE